MTENQISPKYTIDGDDLNYPKTYKIVRYHLVIPTVPRELLILQDLASCDYFRTPVIFQGPDIFVFVGHQRFHNPVLFFSIRPRTGATRLPI